MARSFGRLHKNKYILALIGGLLSAGMGWMPSGYAVDSPAAAISLHAAITREALAGMLAAPNLKAVIAANESQDAPGGDGVTEKRRHFDGDVFPAALAYINREKTRALNLAGEADTDTQSRSDALRHLGLMLHTAQDFYLHTNYVELALEVPQHKNDPYNIPLVDWASVPNGYSGSRTGARLTSFDSNSAVDQINKDAATTHGGKIKISSDITQFTIAKELAIKETQRQWNLFETLLRNRCAGRASAIIAALRKADPTVESKPEAASP